MRIKVYQIDDKKDINNLKFRCFGETVRNGKIDASIYKCVFHGDVDAETLEDVFSLLNSAELPGTYQGHSLSVSDIVEIIGEISAYHFCDSIGWNNIDFSANECASMDGIRVLMIEPGRSPVETRVIDDYTQWQRAVSDHGEPSLMEVTYPFEDSALVVGNEEAKLIGMKGNRRIGSSIYAGPIFIVNDDGKGNFCDLTEEQLSFYSKMFEHPEDICEDEVQADCGFEIIMW